jgi:hypothetical protein
MSVQTDKTLSDWTRAATALGQETSILIMAEVSRAAHRIGASADTEGDALPHAFLAVWRNGVSVEHAARTAVRSLHYTEQTRLADPDFVSLDDVVTSAQRDALEVAVQSSRDEVARSYGGGSRGEILSLSEALESAPSGARAIIHAVITDGLTRKIPDSTVQTTTHEGATGDDAMALHGGVKKRHGRTATYRPLKVSVIASAAGVARPRTKADSDTLKRAGCRAYAMVQALRDDSESVDSLASSAYAYVTRDRRAYGGHGLAVWNNGARPEDVPYSAYRPLSDFQPDIHTGSHVAPLQPVRGYRANTGSKGRKGPMPGQPLEGIAHGASAAMTPGALFSATGGPNDAGLTAKRSDRADRAGLAAHEAQDARSQGTACKRPVAPIGVHPSSLEGMVCGCGPTNGQALILQSQTRDAVTVTGEPEVFTYWTHALSVCPVPVQGAHGTRCGCGRKRGSLTAKDEHRAR